MNISEIVVALDAEIAQLQKVKALLTGTDSITKRGRGRPAGTAGFNNTTAFIPKQSTKKTKKTKRRTMSPESRARIAAAQKARWEKSRRVAKKATQRAASEQTKKALSAKTVNRKTARVKKATPVKKSAQLKTETSATPSS
jgi:hypothetical protein